MSSCIDLWSGFDAHDNLSGTSLSANRARPPEVPLVLACRPAQLGQSGRTAQALSSLRVLGAVRDAGQAGSRLRLYRAGERGLDLRGAAGVGLLRPDRAHGRGAG